MKWTKKGRVYVPRGERAWAKKYAFPPIPYLLNENVIRMYLAFCDEKMVGRIGFVDLLAENPSKVLGVSSEPVLDIGEKGTFDENGLLPTSIVRVGEKLYLYYVGYQLGTKVRYFQFEGLAISVDGGASFNRAQKVPVIDRSDNELLNRTSAFVRLRNQTFQMWYVGGSNWTNVNGKSLPTYNIRYLESLDGIHWPPEGEVCIDLANDDEYALGKPFIFEDASHQKMFYSVRTRSKGYRIGYAESIDGRAWTRKDHLIGIDVSASGWDSSMVEYASVLRHKEKVYMFYNGNNCGETGFGYAELANW